MTAPAIVERLPAEADDSVKRRQIIQGASQVFRMQGFDAASMGEIAKVAGVSKGTLYVYFKDKDELFEAIVANECIFQAEGIFAFDSQNPDVAGELTQVLRKFAATLCEPARHSPLRMVIAIADRMPHIGKKFYETGPATGIAKAKAYLEAQVAAGRLVVADCEVAAAQLIESSLSTLFKPLLFNFAPPPTPERVDHVVGIAVRTFMAAYAAR
ncbi:MAG TPA: TetR/AcrR family transcriptional regulator [Xanthobacteraceae bacterium]|jgi:AcrR family transcriptional regulator|nr:TetR/AcrR family transcriptional regulator [Xanthobacteraceae bacterium]